MPSRRAFIHGSLTAGALVMCPRLALSAKGGPHPFLTGLFDPTFDEGAAFGAAARRHGIPVHAIRGDAGGVWMNVIEPHWKHRPGLVAGLTSRAALFCFELLARDYGMGLIYRIEHVLSGDVGHTITGPQELTAWRERLSREGEHWGAAAAQIAMTCPGAVEASIGLLDPAEPPGVRSVFSWAFGPKQRPGVLRAQPPMRG